MTSGERMVWAAAFAIALVAHQEPIAAAYAASKAVAALRDAWCDRSQIGDDGYRAMLDDMLSTGDDR